MSYPLGSGTGSLVLASPGHAVRWGVAAQCRFVGRSEHLSAGGTQHGERTFSNEGIRKLPEEVAYGLGEGRREVMHRATGQRVSHEQVAETGECSLWTGHAPSPAMSLPELLGQAASRTRVFSGLRAFVHTAPSCGTSFLQADPQEHSPLQLSFSPSSKMREEALLDPSGPSVTYSQDPVPFLYHLSYITNGGESLCQDLRTVALPCQVKSTRVWGQGPCLVWSAVGSRSTPGTCGHSAHPED